MPALRASSFPVSDEPVNEIMSTAGCWTRWSPMRDPRPVTTCSTPAGTPARWQSSTIADPTSAPCVGGLSTTAFPAMRPGATFDIARFTG